MDKTCSKCDGRMIKGFLPETAHGGMFRQTWIEGEKPSKFVQKKGMELVTYACETCGYIESYLDKD